MKIQQKPPNFDGFPPNYYSTIDPKSNVSFLTLYIKNALTESFS